MTLYIHRMSSPFGDLGLAVDESDRLVRIEFVAVDTSLRSSLEGYFPGAELVEDETRTATVEEQLGEYFAGERRSFDLELAPVGTAFQKAVWRELLDIPAGETRTYSEVVGVVNIAFFVKIECAIDVREQPLGDVRCIIIGDGCDPCPGRRHAVSLPWQQKCAADNEYHEHHHRRRRNAAPEPDCR